VGRSLEHIVGVDATEERDRRETKENEKAETT